MKLNKTIHKFKYAGNDYEIDWLTDATCLQDEMVCDVFDGSGMSASCVGQIIIKTKDSKKKIERLAKVEIAKGNK